MIYYSNSNLRSDGECRTSAHPKACLRWILSVNEAMTDEYVISTIVNALDWDDILCGSRGSICTCIRVCQITIDRLTSRYHNGVTARSNSNS